MKKLLLVALVAVAAFATTEAKAQYFDGAAKTNFFGLFFGQYQLAYELPVNANSTVQLSGGLINRNWGIGNGDQTDRGLILIPEYRYYFDESMKGLYVGGFVRYRSASSEWSDAEGDIYYSSSRSSVGGGALIGYQFVISEKMVIDLFAGPQYKSVDFSIDDEFMDDEMPELNGESDGFGGRFGLNIGLGW
ncbi:MAG: DUF3575 domain-containing protein [Cyclobacteriaceae bacterium]